MRYRVLIVDDEADSREALAELTQRWGYDVQTATDGTEALRRAIEWHPDVILTDLVMPNMDGLWLLRALRAELPDCPVVLLTGRGTIQAAVQAIREGAFDFIEKPLEVPRLRIVMERALEKKETMREVQLLRRRLAALAPGSDMIGSGPAMQKVFELVKKVAPSNASVVITGESGTGKEVVARAIHNLSPRREKPFLALNCSAIPATLIESELFGYERGSLHRRRAAAGWATSSWRRTAPSSWTRSARCRWSCRPSSCGCWRTTGSAAWAGAARWRWTSGSSAPPTAISRRRSSAGGSARTSTSGSTCSRSGCPRSRSGARTSRCWSTTSSRSTTRETGKRVQGLAPSAMDSLQAYAWPGNIRELRNTVERAMILVDGDIIGEEHLPPDMQASRPEAAATLRVPLGHPHRQGREGVHPGVAAAERREQGPHRRDPRDQREDALQQAEPVRRGGADARRGRAGGARRGGRAQAVRSVAPATATRPLPSRLAA